MCGRRLLVVLNCVCGLLMFLIFLYGWLMIVMIRLVILLKC